MDRRRTRGETEGRDVGRGYGAPGYGQGFGRDFGGGLNTGFDGSWGQGYGGSLAPSDYRVDTGGEDYGGGFSGGDYDRSFGGRGGGFGGGRGSEDVYGSSYGGGPGQGGGSFAAHRGGPGMGASERGDQARRAGGPHRGRGPAGWRRNDEAIREEICELLAEDPRLDASGLEIEVKDGEVTLKGHARSRPDALHAETIVAHVGGVRGVRNEALHEAEARPPQGRAQGARRS